MPRKGQHLSHEAREKIRQARLGTHHTEEWKIKHSQQMSGINHPMYGKHHLRETKEKIRVTIMSLGDKHPKWKGDNVKINALHYYIKKRKPKPALCENCKLVPPRDLANITGKYSRELKNWKWFCKRCHIRFDNLLYIHLI